MWRYQLLNQGINVHHFRPVISNERYFFLKLNSLCNGPLVSQRDSLPQLVNVEVELCHSCFQLCFLGLLIAKQVGQLFELVVALDCAPQLGTVHQSHRAQLHLF